MRTAVDDCNCNALRKAARRVTQFYDEKLSPTGLRVTQFTILVMLIECPDMSVNELATRLDLDRTTTGKNLRLLGSAGLVAVVSSSSDRRARLVQLTMAGRTALHAAGPLWKEAQRDFNRANGADVAATLRKQLVELRFGDHST